MPFRRKVVGVGMLAREDFVFDLRPANFDQSVELWELFTFASMSLAEYEPGSCWQPTAHAACALLKARGFPDRAGFYREVQVQWARYDNSDQFELDMMLASRSPDSFGHFLGGLHENHPIYAFCRLDDLAKHRFGVLSDEHLAAQFITQFRRLELAREHHMYAVVERLAFALGQLGAEWALKERAESDWQRGINVRIGGRKGAQIRYEIGNNAERGRVIESLRAKLCAGVGLMEARKQVAKMHRISPRTVQRYERVMSFKWTLAPTDHS